jgi:hypothetical protein
MKNKGKFFDEMKNGICSISFFLFFFSYFFHFFFHFFFLSFDPLDASLVWAFNFSVCYM